MAEVVESFGAGPHGNHKYRWEEWLDGQAWKLTRGVDFTVSPNRFRQGSSLQVAAAKRGMRVRTHVDGDSVIIQAYKR